MKRLKQYSFWEYMRVLLVFIAGLAVSLLVFSYNVQVRTEQNVEELLDYNTDHQQSQLKFMLNTQFIYLGNIADYVAKEDSLMCEKNQELLSCMTQDTLSMLFLLLTQMEMELRMMEKNRKLQIEITLKEP